MTVPARSDALAPAHVARLRQEALLERETALEHRVRSGEDPAVAYDEVPETDDFVVFALRDELLEEQGRLAEFGLARLAARSGADDAEEHRRNADRVEFEILREIARRAPQLTRAVWRLGSRLSLD